MNKPGPSEGHMTVTFRISGIRIRFHKFPKSRVEGRRAGSGVRMPSDFPTAEPKAEGQEAVPQRLRGRMTCGHSRLC